MAEADFRLYGSLNDFLPPYRQQRSFPYAFNPPQSVKHLIEALGVPHPEVALILVSGSPVDFHYLVGSGDRVAVYPNAQGLGLATVYPLRPASPVKFILDNHLGSLARYMRLVGLDTRYPTEHLPDARLAKISDGDNRVLLSRDRRLLMRRNVTHGYCPRSTDGWQQLREVITQFELQRELEPWRRCAHCNGLLEPVAKEEIIDQLEPKTRKHYYDFRRCRGCGQIYWKGSHFEKLSHSIEALFER
ncbi:Mut7-C RNAse domain-containing protein [Marinimicrobium locisalis]|uniref:Mut7-C RNAse domain-containing protein n=1 Tax=Marinimicrobium locisalis TaxID=546022 RepID=UPI00322168C0